MRRTATLALIGLSIAGTATLASAQGIGLSSDQMTRTKDAVLQGYTPAQPAAQLNATRQPAASLAAPIASPTGASRENIPSAMTSAMTPRAPGSGSGGLTVAPSLSGALGTRSASSGEFEPWQTGRGGGGGEFEPWQMGSRGGGEFEPWQMGSRGGGEFEPWQMRAPLLGFSSALQGSSIEALPPAQSAPQLNR